MIRHLRQSRRLSQAELAELVHISPSYLSQLEGDKREPTIPLLRRMAATLGAPAVLLFAGALAGDRQAPANDLLHHAIERLIQAVGASLQQHELSFPPDQ
ncbi:MAG: helix-turn-helix transcriptional regulator [Gemmatimonadales bacterium]|nr:helix-turn-helix transcriptional regulator [Gemmatimonadales bacterium]